MTMPFSARSLVQDAVATALLKIDGTAGTWNFNVKEMGLKPHLLPLDEILPHMMPHTVLVAGFGTRLLLTSYRHEERVHIHVWTVLRPDPGRFPNKALTSTYNPTTGALIEQGLVEMWIEDVEKAIDLYATGISNIGQVDHEDPVEIGVQHDPYGTYSVVEIVLKYLTRIDRPAVL